MVNKLSPSSLNLMADCPRCFWLQFNKDIKRPAGIFPSLTSGMDGILKTHFDNFRDKGELPPELCDNAECKNLKLFDNQELLKEWRNSRKGLWFEDKEGNILHGGIDNMLVNKTNGKLIVLDYKTRGFPLKEDTAEHYQNQLDIYNFLLRKNGYETEDYAYLLFYHPNKVSEKGDFIFNTNLVRMKICIQNAEDIFKEALKVLEERIPKPAGDCEYCKWVDNYNCMTE